MLHLPHRQNELSVIMPLSKSLAPSCALLLHCCVAQRPNRSPLPWFPVRAVQQHGDIFTDISQCKLLQQCCNNTRRVHQSRHNSRTFSYKKAAEWLDQSCSVVEVPVRAGLVVLFCRWTVHGCVILDKNVYVKRDHRSFAEPVVRSRIFYVKSVCHDCSCIPSLVFTGAALCMCTVATATHSELEVVY